jgi:hypothetical protein
MREHIKWWEHAPELGGIVTAASALAGFKMAASTSSLCCLNFDETVMVHRKSRIDACLLVHDGRASGEQVVPHSQLLPVACLPDSRP